MSEAADLFNTICAKMGVTILVSEVGTKLISRSCCARGGLLNDQAMLLGQADDFAADCDNPFYTCNGSNASQDHADDRKLAALRRWSKLPCAFIGRLEGALSGAQVVDLLQSAGHDAAVDWVGGFECVFSSATAEETKALAGAYALSFTPNKCGDCWYGAYPCVPDRRGVRGPNPRDNYYDEP